MLHSAPLKYSFWEKSPDTIQAFIHKNVTSLQKLPRAQPSVPPGSTVCASYTIVTEDRTTLMLHTLTSYFTDNTVTDQAKWTMISVLKMDHQFITAPLISGHDISSIMPSEMPHSSMCPVGRGCSQWELLFQGLIAFANSVDLSIATEPEIHYVIRR